ncbi:hypothetical protein D0Z07_6443 [Hyphodiscus hymeniophilus]|uniref:Uncharacterized protein n=1 Tax=Hyphodiscus hymeniophilus TaxID=353542 RepID=A0A9P6VFI5_9HELO|nr:hypothetical protein D0Z07_6443 [Hyphodiscus hymeniophilus]
MDFVKNLTGGNENQGQETPREQGEQSSQQENSGSSGSFFSGIGDKLNSAAGGGKEGEKNEDMLDKGLSSATSRYNDRKSPDLSIECLENSSVISLTGHIGIDMFQEKVLGQGPQDNESALEQAKDEQISDFIRGKYKAETGSDLPIQDKETRFG